MNEDDLFMNDTLDNFTFSDIKGANKEKDSQKVEISFDDSNFLRNLINDLETIESNVHKQGDKKESLKNTDKEVLNENSENLISSQNFDKQGLYNLTTNNNEQQFFKENKTSEYVDTPKTKPNMPECTNKTFKDKTNAKQKTQTLFNQIQNISNQQHISKYKSQLVDKSISGKLGSTQSNVENFKLSSWGLPQMVLEKYHTKKIEKMFSWQVECLSNPKVLNKMTNLIYSAPTSAGKTLVAEILALKTIFERNKKVIFILPFVSIVREKMYYFQDILGSSGIRVEGFMGSYNPPGGFSSIQLAICTIEKANSLINRLLEEGKLSEIGAVLVDEIHLLGDSHRGYLLELLLTKLRYISLKDAGVQIQIIGMSATLPNLNCLAKWLGAELYSSSFRPIPLHEQVLVCGEIYDKNLKLVRKLEKLPELGVDTDNILQLCLETIQESCSVLIFCPTKNWCENLAQQLSTAIFKIGNSPTTQGELLRSQIKSDLILEVLEQLKFCPVGLDKILHKTVSFGIAFHHAGLTMDERDIIEGAFRNGALRILVATSTLSSGVNLPARRVIIRSPNFHGKPIDLLTYRQMIGRAGRMGKDTMGESFLICQKNDYKLAKELMSGMLPAIESCLEGAGKLKRAILEVVASGVASSPEDVTLFTKCTLLAATDYEKSDLNNPIDEAVNFLKNNEFIWLQTMVDGKEKYVPTSLGKACLSSSIAPDEGLALFTELEKARQCFVLETELHLIYLVTPYSACNSWGNIDWMFYLDIWDKLSLSMKRVGELVGVRESYLVNATRGQLDTSNSKAYHRLMVHKRFFVALALQDLVNEKPLGDVCLKFSCNRGMLQSLQQSSSTFAGMVTSFSRQLGWSSVEILLSQFQDRMQFGVSRDLLDLMRLSSLNGKMARTLYNAGIETVIQLANSDLETIENILHRAGPFESAKEREGESKHENEQRNKLRTVWVAGKEGLTEKEAAELLVGEARNYLKIEMGLKEAKWKNINDDNVETSLKNDKLESRQNSNQNAVDLGIEEKRNEKDNDELKDPMKKVRYSGSQGKDKLLSNIEPSNIFFSARDSTDSIKINNSLETSVSSFNLSLSSDSDGNKKTATLADEKTVSIQNITFINKELFSSDKCIIALNKDDGSKKDPSKDSFEINISNSSSMFSDISFTRLEENLHLENNNKINQNVKPVETKIVSKDLKPLNFKKSEVSNLFMSNSPVEFNISESSVFSCFGNCSTSEDKSDQSLIEDSFSLQLTDETDKKANSPCSEAIEDFESDTLFNKALNSVHFNQEFIHNDQDNMLLETNEYCLRKRSRSSSSSRSDDYLLEATPTKKTKMSETPFSKTIKRISQLNINDKIQEKNVGFSKINIICVNKHDSLVDIFFDELREKSCFSFSVACSKVAEVKPVIGANIVKSKEVLSVVSNNKNMWSFNNRKVDGFAISWGETDAYYFSTEDKTSSTKIVKEFSKMFANDKLIVRMFDAKEQIKVLKSCYGYDILCKIEDPKVADWLLDTEGNEKNLQAMTLSYCKYLKDLAQLSGKCKGIGSSGLDLNALIEPKIRVSVDAIVTWHLNNDLNEILKKQMPRCHIQNHKSFPTTYDLEMRIIMSIANLEISGMSASQTSLQNLVELLKTQQTSIEKKAYSLAGRRFNFNSSSDVSKIIGKFKGRKVSTRKQVLEQSEHPISELILQWRKINFTLTKMVYPLIRCCQNDRIYGCYMSHTATGRITMHEPNIQMVTKDFKMTNSLTKNEIIVSCRSAFRTPDGWLLISADYCQLELRILTYLSKDKLLTSIMKKPGDIFRSIAAKWNNVTEDMVDESMRQNVKQMCYGIIYGMGAKTLAEQMGIPEEDAKHFMESFRNTYSGIKDFIKETVDSCRENGYVETITGRRRYLSHINHADTSLRSQAERQAFNTTIQGSAADIVKNAMIIIEEKLYLVFKKSRHKPMLTLHLHDELIYEVPEKYVKKVVKIIRKGMENSAVSFGHFPVKVKTGKSWGELTDYIL